MEISIVLLSVAQSSVPQTWIIVAGLATGQSLGSFVLEQPSQSLEEKEVLWYVEEFALNDPYSESRGREVARHLDNYATRLACGLRPAVSQALKETSAGNDRVSLRLHVQACENTVNIHNIKWELLERPAACVELLNAKSILVIRQVVPILPAPAPPLRQPKFNILFLAARHTSADPIPYRIISLPVWEIAKTARKEGLDVQLYFARPGTWHNLKATLEGHAKCFFSVAHFDLHGVRLSDQSFHLRFSPSSFEDQTPEDMSVEVVAELLSKHGIRTVVLNACNSGNQPLDSNIQSPAHTFISKGIPEVVAMSYAVMKATAADFMTAFYKKLLLERSTTAQAVYQGRKYLREHATKEGRLSLHVEVQDDFLPVLYQRKCTPCSLFEHHKSIPDKVIVDASRQGELSDEQTTPNMSLLGRENDLLAIETALSEKTVVKVRGDHGVGKTCFANRLLRWWRETGFVDHIFAVDFTDLSTTIVDALLKKMNGDLGLPRNAEGKRSILVCIDNFNVRKADDVSNEKRNVFDACVARLKVHYPRSMWLLFSRCSEDASTNHNFPIAKHLLKALRTDEAAQLVRHGFRSGGFELPYTHESNEDLEEFSDHHNGNPLTLELFGSLLPFFGSIRTMLQQLKFGLPQVAQWSLAAAFHKNGEMSSEAPSVNLKTYFNEMSNTLYEFRILMEALKGHSRLALHIALSLAVCQRAMPSELQDWAAWLFRSGGPLSNGSSVGATPSKRLEEVPTSKRQERLQEPVENSLEAQQCVTWVVDQLMNFGFITLASPESSELAPKHFEVHPLLPYLLRFEITNREIPMLEDVHVKMRQLPSMLWHMYEARIASLVDAMAGTKGPRGVPTEVRDFLEAERTNIYNSIEACVHEPEFGYQTMHVLWILFSEANVELYPAWWVRAQTRLLDYVLRGLETLYQERNYRSALARPETADALQQIMMLTWWRGNTLLGAEDNAAALENAKRGLRVLETLAGLLSHRYDLEAMGLALRCQAASVPPLSGSTHALEQLLAEQRPSGLGRDVARILDESLFLVRTRYLQAKGGAAGPDGLSFKDLAALYAHTLRGSELSGFHLSNHNDLLRNLEDENLDEERWLTKIKPALTAAFIEAGYEYPYSAAKLYLWRASMLKTDKGLDRESLQRAVEVAKRAGDLKAQISGLDGLFLLARGEDVRAAMKIHENLIRLEQDMKSWGLDWERTEASERNCSIGVQLIPSKDTDPNAGDLYCQARPYFQRAIQGIYGATRGISEVKAKHLRVLYRAHMGLSFCGNFTGDRNEYVSNTLSALQVDLFMSPPSGGKDWGQGNGMRWVLEEYEKSIKTSTVSVFIAQMAEVIKWDTVEVLRFLLQCKPPVKTLLREGSRQALEETQRILFGPREVDTGKLKYWQYDKQGAWTLDASKLGRSHSGATRRLQYIAAISAAVVTAFWAWKYRI